MIFRDDVGHNNHRDNVAYGARSLLGECERECCGEYKSYEVKSSAGGECFGEHSTSKVEKGVRDLRSSTGEEEVRQLKSSI